MKGNYVNLIIKKNVQLQEKETFSLYVSLPFKIHTDVVLKVLKLYLTKAYF